MQLGRNAVSIYQDLVDHHGFEHRYNSVKRFVHTLRGREPERFDVLPAPMRAEVRDTVRERLTPFDHDGRLVMSVEMVIGSGRA